MRTILRFMETEWRHYQDVPHNKQNLRHQTKNETNNNKWTLLSLAELMWTYTSGQASRSPNEYGNCQIEATAPRLDKSSCRKCVWWWCVGWVGCTCLAGCGRANNKRTQTSLKLKADTIANGMECALEAWGNITKQQDRRCKVAGVELHEKESVLSVRLWARLPSRAWWLWTWKSSVGANNFEWQKQKLSVHLVIQDLEHRVKPHTQTWGKMCAGGKIDERKKRNSCDHKT